MKTVVQYVNIDPQDWRGSRTYVVKVEHADDPINPWSLTEKINSYDEQTGELEGDTVKYIPYMRHPLNT
jgi:hypothetical protein